MTIVSTIKTMHRFGIICTGNHLEWTKEDNRGYMCCSNMEEERIGRYYFTINFTSKTTHFSNFLVF